MAAAICGAFGVMLGAYGAHGLQRRLESGALDSQTVSMRVDQFETGSRYHLIHAVALLGLSSVSVGSQRIRGWIASLMIMGIILFSGSLYFYVLTEQKWAVHVTPVGGLTLILAWGLVGCLAVSQRQDVEN